MQKKKKQLHTIAINWNDVPGRDEEWKRQTIDKQVKDNGDKNLNVNF